jgi:hypothetical protein
VAVFYSYDTELELCLWAERGWRLWNRMKAEHEANTTKAGGGNDRLAHAMLRSEMQMQKVLDAAAVYCAPDAGVP